jgi:hypothetical protein
VPGNDFATNPEETEMPRTDTCCSLAPYFDVAEGKLDEFKALGKTFVELTMTEPGCLFYAFSFSGQPIAGKATTTPRRFWRIWPTSMRPCRRR